MDAHALRIAGLGAALVVALAGAARVAVGTALPVVVAAAACAPVLALRPALRPAPAAAAALTLATAWACQRWWRATRRRMRGGHVAIERLEAATALLAGAALALLRAAGGFADALIVAGIASFLVASLVPPAGERPVGGWTVANTVIGYGLFALACIALPFAAPLAWLMPGGRARWIARALRRAMRAVLALTPEIAWRLAGDAAALAAARVVVANHEGMLDILAACALPGTRTLLAKAWVFRAFPLGLAARAAGLRDSDALEADDYQGDAARTIGDDVGIFVFAEGTRSRDGRVARFRPGAFVLARALGAPVVAVAVAGSRIGIAPGSMWIHPTRALSRVLGPIPVQPDESNRAWAERCRVAVVAARDRDARALLVSRAWRRNRREAFVGVGGGLRRAVVAEERAGAWRLLADAPFPDDGDWLILGAGWSTLPVALRQLAPAARCLLVEPDARRRDLARHAWWRRGDVVALVGEALPLPERLTGVIALDPVPSVLLARVAAASPGVVIGDGGAWGGAVPTLRVAATRGGVSLLVAAIDGKR